MLQHYQQNRVKHKEQNNCPNKYWGNLTHNTGTLVCSLLYIHGKIIKMDTHCNNPVKILVEPCVGKFLRDDITIQFLEEIGEVELSILVNPLQLSLVGCIALYICHIGREVYAHRITEVGMDSPNCIFIPTLIVDYLINPDIGIFRIITRIYLISDILLYFLINHHLGNSDKKRIRSI